MAKKKIEYTAFDQIADVESFRDSIHQFFSGVPDPRASDNITYPLSSLLVIMLMAVLAGANNISDIHQYAEDKQILLKELLDFDDIPEYGTFWWLITRLDPREFSSAFNRWTEDVRIQTLREKLIHVDGKTLRGTRVEQRNSVVHMVHAWSSGERLLLGQLKTAEKSNEITAIPELLNSIDIQGATITIDAAGAQKNTARTIRQGGGDYILALKENQPKLYDEVIHLFETAHAVDFYGVPNCDLSESVEKGHGRIETRKVAICSDMSILEESVRHEWDGIATFIEVTSERIVSGKISVEKRYYISSLEKSAHEFGKMIRAHWSVENSLHWCLDVVFREDESRAQTLHAGENLGTLRRMALNLFNQDKETKLGLAGKRKRAGWNDQYVKKLLELFVKNF